MARAKQHHTAPLHTAPLHVRHAAKVVKITKRSRLWCELATCAGTAYETHLVVLTIVSILWVIADIAIMFVGVAEEI